MVAPGGLAGGAGGGAAREGGGDEDREKEQPGGGGRWGGRSHWDGGRGEDLGEKDESSMVDGGVGVRGSFQGGAGGRPLRRRSGGGRRT